MEQFDSLKRQATKLERSLEDKVARYQQLVQSIPDVTTNDLFLAESGMAGSTHTVASTAEDEAAQRHDIQRALTTLQDLVTRQLQPRAEQLGKSLLVKRYREILFDLSGDFETSRQAHTRKVERSKLMGGVGTAKAGQHQHGNVDHLMRERNHIHNSTTAAASVLHQATEIRNDLRSQGLSLGRARSGMAQIANNIPGINVLVDQIRKKRSKDERIVIGVIASCILFTLYYLFGG